MRLYDYALVGIALAVGIVIGQAQSIDVGSISPNDRELWLRYRPAPTSVPNAAVSRHFTLEHSADLVSWETVDDIDLSLAYGYQNGLRVPEALLGSLQGYFRMRVDETYRFTTDNAAEYFGLEGVFTSALVDQYFDQPEDLLDAYPARTFAGALPWDVTEAEFWELYNTDPAENNVGRDPLEDGWRLKDYRLNEEERAVLDRHGFVVSERLGSHSFGDALYDLWTDDMPVFISTDALLQAWHYSFQTTLEEVDAFVMAHELEKLLVGLRAGLASRQALAEAGDSFLKESFADLDLFLSVALSLLRDDLVDISFADADQVRAYFEQTKAAEGFGEALVFGQWRLMDFTQFTPRGHYVKSEVLTRYFRAMMWCLQVDFRLTPTVEEVETEVARNLARRQLAAAALLTQVLREDGLQATWQTMENVIAAVGGYADALVVPQLAELLDAAGLMEVGSVSDLGIAEAFEARLLEGSLGIQDIRSHPILSPRFTQQQAVLPRSFSFFSQRFVLDSWAMSKLVFDSIIYDDNGIPEETDKVWRRIPSGLDVVFTVLKNDAILSAIVQRMHDPNGRRYRDGLFFQNNLAAVRAVMDGQPASAWEGNVYHHWLGTLRALSESPAEPTLPHAFRTRAWAMKDVNTQLASWTQLRHDTILYAKQSSTALTICSFPDGYVEPHPEFWARLSQMSGAMQALIASLPAEGSRVAGWNTIEDLSDWKRTLSAVFEDIAQRASQLQGLVAKQLSHEAFSEADLAFIDAMMQDGGTVGSGGERRYDGWYPSLFYDGYFSRTETGAPLSLAAGKFGALVTDVHTDFPDVISGDPGTILHEGVGGVPLLMIAVEREDGRKAIFAGPVLSHYEFDTEGTLDRLTDEEWKSKVVETPPVPGPWTREYLVPHEGGIPYEVGPWELIGF